MWRIFLSHNIVPSCFPRFYLRFAFLLPHLFFLFIFLSEPYNFGESFFLVFFLLVSSFPVSTSFLTDVESIVPVDFGVIGRAGDRLIGRARG